MARPQVPGWNNINLNKPDEYSAEFRVDGNRYANVTNVANGQRQLYLVSGIGGTPITQRTLLTTTNSDGTNIKGEGYDDFIRVYGQNKLTNAEINNKKQSDFIIKKASTDQEKIKLGKSDEYKSSIGNLATVDPNATNSEQTLSQDELKDISKNTNDLVKVQQLQDKAFRNEYGNYKYPITFPDEQDRITFKMFRYNPKTLAISENDLGVFQGGNKGKEIFGSVTLPITPSISDLNAVNWGNDEMNALQALAAAASYNTITTGVKGAEQSAMAIAEGLKGGKGDIAKAAAAYLAGEAAGGNKTFLSRVTGAILNPNMELLFNGPQLRTHSFSFTLSAREEKESKEIRNIIRFFKQGMSVKRASSNLFLKAPNIFDISYHYRDQKDNHPWINQIKTCALTSCQVNYTPAGNYATYYDGSMTSYELTLSFSEIDPIFEDDYHKIDGSVNGPINDIGY